MSRSARICCGNAGLVRAILRLDRAEEALLFAHAQRQLDRVGLADVAFKPAGTLALGQLRLVEVARALCLNPVLLLLDEPAAGLRVGEKKALARLLREVRSEGISVLLVEHDMDFVMSLADRAGGARFRHQDRRRRAGRDPAGSGRARSLSRRRVVTAPLLEVRDLCVSYGRAQVVHDVSIAVTAGALVTVIGSNGAGKTTLLNAIMGLLNAQGPYRLSRRRDQFGAAGEPRPGRPVPGAGAARIVRGHAGRGQSAARRLPANRAPSANRRSRRFLRGCRG